MSLPELFLGKAIKSLIESDPPNIKHSLSNLASPHVGSTVLEGIHKETKLSLCFFRRTIVTILD